MFGRRTALHALPLVLAAALAASVGPQAAAAADKPVEAKLERLEGGSVKLSELRGAPLLLDLWATWCAPCIEQARILHELAPELAERGVQVLAVDVGEPRDTVESFVADRPGTFPVVLDRAQVIARRLDVGELPALVLLRADGTAAGTRLGLTQGEDILALLATLAD